MNTRADGIRIAPGPVAHSRVNDGGLESTTDRETPMKTITRFVRLLQEINANGPLSIAQLAKASGIPYTTTGRIVRTMLHHALIEHEPNGRRYRVAVMALSLSNGFQGPERPLEVNQQLVAKQSW